MSTIVDLSVLQEVLEQKTSRRSSFPGAFVAVLAMGEVVAGLHGGGILVPLALRLFSQPEGLAWAAILAIVGHIALVVLAWVTLEGSALRGDIESSRLPRSLFGHANPEEPWYLTRRLAAVGVLAVAVGLLVTSAPVPASARGGFLLLLAAPLVAWALVTLASSGMEMERRLKDSSVKAGALCGAVAVVLGLFLLWGSSFSGWEALPEWFTITEGLILCALPLVLLANMLRMPNHAVYRLTASNPNTAPAVVQYDPFDYARREPRYMTFGVSEGQIIVLTRELNAREWQLVDVTDGHAMTPIHDRSLMVWNLTRLSQMIPSRIETRDRSDCFHLALDIGRLSLPAGIDTGMRLKHWAVAAANDVLFRNPDLKGLVSGAARQAFDDQLQDLADEVEDLSAFLDRAPTHASLASASQSVHALRAVDGTAAEFFVTAQKGDAYLAELADQQQKFRGIKRRAVKSGASIEQGWLTHIRDKITKGAEQMEGERGVDVGDALRVLKVVGLRSNGAQVTLVDNAARCEAQLPIVRAAVDQFVAEARRAHREALELEDRRRAELEQKVVNEHALTRDDQREIVRARMRGELPGQRRVDGPLPGQQRVEGTPPPPTLPSTEALDDEDDAPLN